MDKIINVKNLIIGGGLSGLGFHNTCSESLIIEASDSLGGHAKSKSFKGFFFDQGAHINHSKNSDWIGLLNTENVNEAKSDVKNYYDGLFFGYPVQSNLSALGKEKTKYYLQELLIARMDNREEPKNYKEWCLKTYGTGLTNDFYKVFTEKYWRTEMENLSTNWLKGRLINSDLDVVLNGALGIRSNDKAVFNHFKYPRTRGFQSFFENIVEGANARLKEKIVELRLNDKSCISNKGNKYTYDNLINSIPLTELVQITSDLPSEIKEASNNLRYTSLVQINLIVNRSSLSNNKTTWFYVYDKKFDISRVSIMNNLSGTSSSQHVGLQLEIFRRNDEVFNVDELKVKAIKDIQVILNIKSDDIIDSEVNFIKFAYVISDHNCLESVRQIHKYYEGFDAHMIGIYGNWEYMWSDAAYYNGVSMAKKLLNNNQ
jgi:protoporphyrinogen oxidase